MAKLYGKRSECLKEIDQWNNIFTAVYSIIFLAIPGIIFWSYINGVESLFTIWSRIGLAFLLILVANHVHRKALRYEKATRKIKKDLKAESMVWYELRKLPDEYSIYEGVRVNEEKSIDFVVAGPTGVFTIDVNSYRGKVVYKDGKLIKRRKRVFKKDPIENAIYNTVTLHEYLLQRTGKEIYVKPIIVFPSCLAKVKLGVEPIDKGVSIIRKKHLRKVIPKQDKLFKEEDLPQVENALKGLA